MSHNDVVAGDLAELYKDGTTTLPAVAALFGTARKAFASAEVGTQFDRSAKIDGSECVVGGGASSGPKASFNAVLTALEQACKQNDTTLELIGENLVTTVQNFVSLNSGLAAIYQKDGGELRG